MSLSEKLVLFAGGVLLATRAPDGYSESQVELRGSMKGTYEDNKSTVLEDWAEIRPELKRDLDKVAFIDAKLTEGFDAFDRGDREVGKKAMFDIYNLQLRMLR